MVNDNLNLDRIVKEILKKSTPAIPSNDFTLNVMSNVSQLKPNWMKAEQPLISRKGWLILSISFLLMFAFIIIISNLYNVDSGKQITYLQNYNQIINSFNLQLSKILAQIKLPFWLPLGFFFIMLALFIDSFIRRIFRLNKTF
ncbi:MAG: hypothetical protein HZB41_03465 [Ignavibacteriae bacterium]|nr:hypothetical protein [Ignavibacteriota bacterium]